MSEPYLVAHVVRGEPAFDIAVQMVCPECQGMGKSRSLDGEGLCVECDSTGYWWVIPTSGHRAYPYWHMGIEAMFSYCPEDRFMWGPPITPPTGWPDHYPTKASPSTPSLALALGLHNLRSPSPPIKRRA